MRRALVALVALGSVAHATPVRGTLAFPENKGEPARGYWRVENGLQPVAPHASEREAVVVLDGSKPVHRSDEPPAITVELRGLRLEPKVVVVPVGGTIHFKNSDRGPHTLYVENTASLMPPSTTPAGQVRTQKFGVAGEYPLRDEECPHIEGTIVAVDTPYVAQPDEHGGWKLDAPEGHYTLRVFWRGAWVLTRPLDVGRAPVEVSLRVPEKGRGE